MRWFALDRGSPLPLIRQIYDEVSAQILRGDMAAGERLPSTREAAAELSVSRNVVLEAYDQLAAEGYVLSIEGAGTYVAPGACLGTPAAAEPDTPASARGGTEGGSVIDFAPGKPALDLVPRAAWARLERDVRLESPAALAPAPSEGMSELRAALSRYLLRKRGIACGSERIIVTSGALQAISLLARLTLKRGDVALVEDPGTKPAADVFRQEGATVLPVPVDEEGLRTDLLPAGVAPRLAFVTPSHQFPLGGCLSIQRRIELVAYARATGCLIVEDDYESEFRYGLSPVSSLQRLDAERVAYVGTFSKILFPGLRLGYLVVPRELVGDCRRIKRTSDRYTAPATQLAMARFMEDGRLDRHVARMKKVYRKRRDALAAALGEAFPGRVGLSGLDTGMHLVATFADAVFDDRLLGSLREAGVNLVPVDDCAIGNGRRPGAAIMGYSHLREEEIRTGVGILRRTLRENR